ncbi:MULTISPECIES: hypothetical protein [unclassified Rhizobium]|uniref:hypothetical protein n=1 Tax=unclassified Rhizobium TaxID=2613769 RepID=UPI0006F9D861|nr:MULTISPECIES: hypothetical protein [unclassified Rhizobium]KQV43509.1 hypothetical protein ASC86_01455 [Rhizobium sp. Root1212]KRD37694.1 hypothetical protein ASE37_01455 [Rhizobium sp. Root268]
MMDLKDWYRSKTVWGALVAVIASCARLAGLEIGTEDQQLAIDALTTIAAAAGGLIAIYGRVSAHKRLR